MIKFSKFNNFENLWNLKELLNIVLVAEEEKELGNMLAPLEKYVEKKQANGEYR